MTETAQNFVLIGDHRDIPMSLGLIIMVWNDCELSIHEILKTLASKGEVRAHRAVEPLIVELGALGLGHALHCYAKEFPTDDQDLAQAIERAADIWDTARVYRNYYVHGISGVTKYGIDFSFDTIERDVPLHEAMMIGPFARVGTHKRDSHGGSDVIQALRQQEHGFERVLVE